MNGGSECSARFAPIDRLLSICKVSLLLYFGGFSSFALLVTCKLNGGVRGAVRRSVSLSIARQRQATRTAVVGSTRVSTASLFVRVKLAVAVT